MKDHILPLQNALIVLPEAIKAARQPEQRDREGKEVSPALDFKALNYNAFIPLLIQGIKEQQAIILNQ